VSSSAAMDDSMCGYNGNLALSGQEVRIERGLKGLLLRKRWSPSWVVPCERVREVWFQPSSRGPRGWPGFVMLLKVRRRLTTSSLVCEMSEASRSSPVRTSGGRSLKRSLLNAASRFVSSRPRGGQDAMW